MNEKPYLITLRNDALEVSLPDNDGDICICIESAWPQYGLNDNIQIYLSKEDVLKLLERFN